jgi:hypothetical protein
MDIAAVANQKDFPLSAVLMTITLTYICTAAVWLSQLM